MACATDQSRYLKSDIQTRSDRIRFFAGYLMNGAGFSLLSRLSRFKLQEWSILVYKHETATSMRCDEAT